MEKAYLAIGLATIRTKWLAGPEPKDEKENWGLVWFFFFSSLNIFHTICGFHTYHSVQHFFFFFLYPNSPNLVKKKKKEEETQNRPNQWKNEKRKRKKNLE